jgi:uncharacterized protein YcbX
MGELPGGTVAWIASTPVKGLRLHAMQSAELTADGIPGDRAFFLVDETGSMVSATRLGPLLAVVAEHDVAAGILTLDFPDGERVSAKVELGDGEDVRFYGRPLRARRVLGPFAEALSEHSGAPVRLYASPPERPGIDRGRKGGVTLLSIGSLERLGEVAAVDEPVDPRRFRMTIGVDGPEAHGEDSWIGENIRVGGALVRVGGHVGRCAATTRAPDTGAVDFMTLHHLASYRSAVQSAEPLPFGVFGEVVEPGRVALGDYVGA